MCLAGCSVILYFLSNRSAFFSYFRSQARRLKRVGAEADEPVLYFPPFRDLKPQNHTSVRLVVDLLAGVPGALLDIRSLRGRKANLHFLRLAPDQIERGLFEFLKVEITWNLKAPIGQAHGLNPLHGEDSEIVFEIIVGDQIKAIVHKPEPVGVNLTLVGPFVVRGALMACWRASTGDLRPTGCE